MPSARHRSKPIARPQVRPLAWTARWPGLFPHLYLALFANGAVFIWSAEGQREENRLWFVLLLSALGIAALLAMMLRPLLQDWFSDIQPSERFLLFAIISASFLTPSLIPSRKILPEGFLFALIPMLFFSADQKMVRRYLAMSLVGFWFALGKSDANEWETVVVFGATTLWSFSAAHFAFVGNPFGLRGWWPVRRIFQAVTFAFIPSTLAGYLAYQIWPRIPAANPAETKLGEKSPSPSVHLSPEQLNELLIRSVLGMFLIVASVVALHYLRRFLNRRARAANLPQVLGADVGELDYERLQPSAPPPTLDGTRGQIVRLWQKWAKRREAEGVIRSQGETASEFAGRVESPSDQSDTRLPLTRLFEKAHYGPQTPSPTEVEEMKALTRSDVEK